ncbi:ABC transporter ATP-binding protein [Moorella sulfitireducens]|uniref:ABC transporter ATP-binding protein n=1 Tax=Neomoorella sulfitireducens TaxID=2972948 RepID=UPI0021AC8818|nr:sn-glycerol-3-phosphate ABC transporter ATP-binding protein UgpC [Moorella sulfitireducens]
MARMLLKNVWKKYGQVVAVKNFNLEINDGEFIVLVGPSGCGKSTTLRMVAGLEEISEGEIYIGERLVNNVPAKDRDIAMVFQNYALYPHMNVYDNLAFGLKMRRVPREEIRRRVTEVAGMLGIEPLLKRKPRALSGGQRQRVALGRAIVREPQVFLMDEPLSNLDAKLRVQMRMELARLQQRLGVTTIYVTHDQTEAMTMGHRIVVMNEGIVQQIDTPMGLYEHPANMFVAGFIGSPPMNFLPVDLVAENGRGIVRGTGFNFSLEDLLPQNLKAANGELVMGLRPEDISLDPVLREKYPGWVLQVRADVVEPLGAEGLVYFTLGDQVLTSRLAGGSLPRPGQILPLVFNLNRAHFFDRQSGKAL